jgi:hypothetical protein
MKNSGAWSGQVSAPTEDGLRLEALNQSLSFLRDVDLKGSIGLAPEEAFRRRRQRMYVAVAAHAVMTEDSFCELVRFAKPCQNSSATLC